MDERGGRELARRRFNAMLLATFAALALIIAAVGVYGVMAHSSAQRTREFGIRVALGATVPDVLRLVLRRAAVLIIGGVALGLVASAALTRVLAAQLYGVGPTDPATFGVICIVLAMSALVATYVPARRATRVEPVVALREST